MPKSIAGRHGREIKQEEAEPEDEEGGLGGHNTTSVVGPNEGEEAAEADPGRHGVATRLALLEDG